MAKYPDIKIVFRADGPLTRERGVKQTEDVLVANPDLAAIYTANDDVALGAMQAVLRRQPQGQDARHRHERRAARPARRERGNLAMTVELNPVRMGPARRRRARHLSQGRQGRAARVHQARPHRQLKRRRQAAEDVRPSATEVSEADGLKARKPSTRRRHKRPFVAELEAPATCIRCGIATSASRRSSRRPKDAPFHLALARHRAVPAPLRRRSVDQRHRAARADHGASGVRQRDRPRPARCSRPSRCSSRATAPARIATPARRSASPRARTARPRSSTAGAARCRPAT